MPYNTSPSRVFVDLINETTGKWANWDPSCILQVGDFGKINGTTGELEVEGNIYKDHHIYNGDTATIALITANPPIEAARENDFIATSLNVKSGDFQLGPDISVPGIAEATLKGQWTFESTRGALLIMAQPMNFYIHHAKLLKHLAKVDYLKDKALVTKVFFTSAYRLYLSTEGQESVNLALLGSSALPQAPVVSVSGQASMVWWSSASSGLVRSGQEPYGSDHYTPLYEAKEIEKKRSRLSRLLNLKRRGSIAPGTNAGEYLYGWVDATPPWRLLDENGNMIQSEDVNEDVDEDGYVDDPSDSDSDSDLDSA